MQLTFKRIVRASSRSVFPDGVVHISPTSITLGRDIVKQLLPTQLQPRTDGDKLRIALSFDKDHDAIQVYSDPDGYMYAIAPAGTASANIPRPLKDENIHPGDYHRFSGEQSDIFVHSDRLEELRQMQAEDNAPPATTGSRTDSDADIKLDDTVEWLTRPHNANAFMSRGYVDKLTTVKRNGKEVPGAEVIVTDKHYQAVYPNRDRTIVLLSNLRKITTKENDHGADYNPTA
jgi:hypothetical protein